MEANGNASLKLEKERVDGAAVARVLRVDDPNVDVGEATLGVESGDQLEASKGAMAVTASATGDVTAGRGAGRNVDGGRCERKRSSPVRLSGWPRAGKGKGWRSLSHPSQGREC